MYTDMTNERMQLPIPVIIVPTGTVDTEGAKQELQV